MRLTDTLLPVDLTPDDRVTLQRLVLARHAAQTDYLIDVASSRWGATDPRAAAVGRFVADLYALATENPSAFAHVARHWATVFVLTVLVHEDGQALGDVEPLLSTLDAFALYDHLSGERTSPPGRIFRTVTNAKGEIYGLHRGIRIWLERERYRSGRIDWKLGEGVIALSAWIGDSLPEALTLPVDRSAPISMLPLDRADLWNIPILEDFAALGLKAWEEVGESSRPDGADRSSCPPPLGVNLPAAYRLVDEHWPSIVDWIRALVPAFIDMGHAQNGATHMSGSFGPGLPVALSRVADPLFHMENLIHELQHQRLGLFDTASAFGCWDDSSPEFRSPYRDDHPTPLRGLHFGLHAHLAVNAFWLKLFQVDAPNDQLLKHVTRVHHLNLYAFQTLVDHERLTPQGREFFKQIADAIVSQHESLKALDRDGISADVAAAVRGALAESHSSLGSVRNGSDRYTSWEPIAMAARDIALATR